MDTVEKLKMAGYTEQQLKEAGFGASTEWCLLHNCKCFYSMNYDDCPKNPDNCGYYQE